MSVVDDFRAFNELVTESFDNVTGTVETFHQSVAALTLEILAELGFPSGAATRLADKHRALLAMTYGTIRSTNRDLGELMVGQLSRLSDFADEIGVPLPNSPATTVQDLTQVFTRDSARK